MRRGEREPAKQPGQRLLSLAINGGPRPLRLIRGRIHPVGRTPDAHIDALPRSINCPAVLASPDDHALRGRQQLIIAAPSCGPRTSQRRTRRLPNRLIRGPPLARARLSPRQLLDDSPEPLDANTTGRRGHCQLVVITAADELAACARGRPPRSSHTASSPRSRCSPGSRGDGAAPRSHYKPGAGGRQLANARPAAFLLFPGLAMWPVRPPGGPRRNDEAVAKTGKPPSDGHSHGRGHAVY